MSEELVIESATQVTAADQVFTFIESEILNGNIPGGSRLRIRQVAELVGTSVMPVREALLRLEDAGLITSVPHKGATVKRFDTREFINIYAVRVALESEAAWLGAPHVTVDDMNRMQVHLQAMERAMSDRRFIDAIHSDGEFLRILYRASGNELICEMIENLWKQSDIYRKTSISIDPNFSTSFTNAQMLDALRARDADAVRDWSRKSIEMALDRLKKLEAENASIGNRP